MNLFLTNECVKQKSYNAKIYLHGGRRLLLLSSIELVTLGAVLVSAITEIFVHGLLIIRTSARRRKGWSCRLVTILCSLERDWRL